MRSRIPDLTHPSLSYQSYLRMFQSQYPQLLSLQNPSHPSPWVWSWHILRNSETATHTIRYPKRLSHTLRAPQAPLPCHKATHTVTQTHSITFLSHTQVQVVTHFVLSYTREHPVTPPLYLSHTESTHTVTQTCKDGGVESHTSSEPLWVRGPKRGPPPQKSGVISGFPDPPSSIPDTLPISRLFLIPPVSPYLQSQSPHAVPLTTALPPRPLSSPPSDTQSSRFPLFLHRSTP